MIKRHRSYNDDVETYMQWCIGLVHILVWDISTVEVELLVDMEEMKNYYTVPHATVPPTLWQRFKMLFRAKYVAFDSLYGDPYGQSYAIFYKIVDGMVFILGSEKLSQLYP